MLTRKEIENYILDFNIVKKAYPNISEEQYKEKIPDIMALTVKSQTGSIMQLCGINTGMSKFNFLLDLAKNITNDTTVYIELKKSIFDL
jgi:hypothetical protein